MKGLLVILMLLLSAVSLNAAYLLQLDFKMKRWVGHGVRMYYVVDDLDSIAFKIAQIDSLNEMSLLGSLGVPLSDMSLDACNVAEELDHNYDKIFRSYKRKVIKIESSEFYVRLKIVKSKFGLCKFESYGNPWSYSFRIREIGTLTSYPKIFFLKRHDKKKFKEIRDILRLLVAKNE